MDSKYSPLKALTFEVRKDIGKLREELKTKESLKDMEKRKQGKVAHLTSEYLTRSSKLGMQRNSRMQRHGQRLKPKSKPTGENELKRRRGKRL